MIRQLKKYKNNQWIKMPKILDFFKKWVYNNKAIEKILEEWEQIPLFNYEKEKKLAKIEEKIESLIKQNIENLGYELYDVEYVKEAKDYFLRIYIDSKKGIDLEDCEKVSNSITELLDKEDVIPEQYFLEVSSPGIERTLKREKHLKDNIGNEVQIKLFKPFEGKKQYKGILKDFDETKIEIVNQNEEQIEIDRKNISQIKTVYNW